MLPQSSTRDQFHFRLFKRDHTLTTPAYAVFKKSTRSTVTIFTIGFAAIIALAMQGCSSSSKISHSSLSTTDTVRSLAPYFTRATKGSKPPDAAGFIQRWLLLEPINKPNRGNTVFVDSYLRTAFAMEYFPGQTTMLPKDGQTVTAGPQQLTWHALESNLFNVKLYRFAYGLNKQTYGVLFWAVTVINSPEEVKNVRLAAGSNSASMWWVNGKEALLLSGDRRMVMDDGLSNRLTLNKGKNIIRGAIINGPGMSDFCVRFLDEQGKPVKNLSITYE